MSELLSPACKVLSLCLDQCDQFYAKASNINQRSIGEVGSEFTAALPWAISVSLLPPWDAVKVLGKCLYFVSLECDNL